MKANKLIKFIEKKGLKKNHNIAITINSDLKTFFGSSEQCMILSSQNVCYPLICSITILKKKKMTIGLEFSYFVKLYEIAIEWFFPMLLKRCFTFKLWYLHDKTDKI